MVVVWQIFLIFTVLQQGVFLAQKIDFYGVERGAYLAYGSDFYGERCEFIIRSLNLKSGIKTGQEMASLRVEDSRQNEILYKVQNHELSKLREELHKNVEDSDKLITELFANESQKMHLQMQKETERLESAQLKDSLDFKTAVEVYPLIIVFAFLL